MRSSIADALTKWRRQSSRCSMDINYLGGGSEATAKQWEAGAV
uniref:Uncharacterized protein n=1 Tax=Arundo donax TaxID=35708 RepID=A0A0A9CJD4_ARUDO